MEIAVEEGRLVVSGRRGGAVRFADIAEVAAEKVGKITYDEVFLILRKHPDCCLAVQPWPVRHYYTSRGYSLGRNKSAERVFADYTEDFRWSHDILIGVKKAPDPANRLSYIDFEQSDCGQTGRNSRG